MLVRIDNRSGQRQRVEEFERCYLESRIAHSETKPMSREAGREEVLRMRGLLSPHPCALKNKALGIVGWCSKAPVPSGRMLPAHVAELHMAFPGVPRMCVEDGELQFSPLGVHDDFCSWRI